MRSQILKKSLTYFLSIVFALATIGTFVFCVFSGFEGVDYISSFFAPEVSQKGTPSPFFRSIQICYKDDQPVNTNDYSNTNIKEWIAFFDNKVTAADMAALLYDSSNTGYIDTLVYYAKYNMYPIREELKRNSINKTDMAKRLEFLYYLGFAKRCEPYVTIIPQIGWGAPEPDPEAPLAREKLIAGGKKLLAGLKLPFVKQRCHFQIVRLLYINDDYPGCSQYMDTYLSEIEGAGTTVIKGRIWSYVATALYRQKEYARANYMFSLIYDQMPNMQKTAMYYFHPMEEKDWGQCLAMAKTNHEKTVMWALAGMKGGDELRAMKEIYRSEPDADVLNLLLVRQINICEESYLNSKYKFSVTAWDQSISKPIAATETSEFVKNILDAPQLHNRPLWYLSLGYLYQMQDKYNDANDLYAKACAMAPHDTLLNMQAHLLGIVSKAEMTTALSPQRENEILADLKWLETKKDSAMRQETSYRAVRDILSRLYKAQGSDIMAELANGFSPQFYLDDAKTKRMVAFINKPDKSPMAQYLISKYEKSTKDMIYFLGLEEVYKDSLVIAKQKWEDNSLAAEILDADPFLIHIRDCHDCDQAAPQSIKYTRMDFLNRMIELKNTAEKSKKDAAQAYFFMANGFYNITYSGNNRMFHINPISYQYSYMGYYYNNDSAYVNFKPDRMDCSLALKYYLLARDASSDPEFKAKCTFMAAKCEHNNSDQVYVNSEGNFNADVDFGKYFQEIKAHYQNTQYEKELINECSYFRIYFKNSGK